MKEIIINRSTYKYGDTFHALCPYFAMFPPEFARKAIIKYSKPGEVVLDPFSGRGTTLLEARLLNRHAVANDINPVAVTITKAKTNPLDAKMCLSEINRLEKEYCKSKKDTLKREARVLPEFFINAYNHNTLMQVLWLRSRLVRVRTPELIFIKTLCLSYLHGEAQKTKSVYFSNNLPHTYCPKPAYSIRFWKKNKMTAPAVDVFGVLRDRCEFRLRDSKQMQAHTKGFSILGDIRKLASNIKRTKFHLVDLIITSPPYIRITSYEEDQWLRLWFLGGETYPRQGKISRDDRIVSVEKYTEFLSDSIKAMDSVLKSGGHIVCRIGQSTRDSFSLKEILLDSVKRSGADIRLIRSKFSPFKKIRQARMFGKVCSDSGEYDFVLRKN